MSLHTTIDRFESKTTRQKLVIVAIVLVVLAAVVAGVMYIGYRWAKSDAEAERTAQDDRIAVLTASGEQHLKNAEQLAAENALLKKQNEAQAEAITQADTERERKALADQARRDKDRADKMSEIDADQNFDSQLKATCDEYRARGFKLSFCARFEVNP
jgi:acyl-CoA synthetase (AMP-forming)/AMP-acid ligase II